MNNNIKNKIAYLLTLLFLIINVVPAAAVERTSPRIERTSSTDNIRPQSQEDIVKRIVSRASEEINRRIDILEGAKSRIDKMTRLTDRQKEDSKAYIDAQIEKLIGLLASIETETDPVVLRQHIAVIISSYRIFAIIIPRTTIYASANRILSVAESFERLGEKLEERLERAASAGYEVEDLEGLLEEMKGEIEKAKENANEAIEIVSEIELDDDNLLAGEDVREKLTDARAKVRAALSNLKAARENTRTIIQTLRELVSGSDDDTQSSSPSTNEE